MTASTLASLPTGVELVCALVAIDVASLDAADALTVVATWERVSAWATAQQNAAMVRFAGASESEARAYVDGRSIALPDSARSELAVELRWSENFAGHRLELARSLTSHLPQTRLALEGGSISMLHAKVIAEGAERLAQPIDHAMNLAGRHDAELIELRHELISQYEDRVVAWASSHSATRTRERVNRTINRLDPTGVEVRRTVAERERSDVRIQHGDDGMSMLTAYLPTELAVACLQRIDDVVAQRFANDGGAGQSRVRAFVALLLDSADPNFAGVPHAQVDVVIDLPTLLGLREGDAIVNGAGSIPAAAVRELITADQSSTLRRLIVDAETGHLIEQGSRRYAVSGRLREYLHMRDQRCRFPDCGRRAHLSDIDHATPWDSGGSSSVDNLGALCRKHHLLKTHAGWQIQASDTSGECEWRSPSGRVRLHEAVSRLDEHDAALNSLRQELAEVWDHIELATELSAPSGPHQSRRERVAAAIDAEHLARHATTIRTRRAHGDLTAILSIALQRHGRRQIS